MAIKFKDGLCGGEAVEFQIVTCANCGVGFMLTSSHISLLRKTHNEFYCPNGHILNYGKTDCEKKKEQLEKELADNKRWNESLIEKRNQLWDAVDELKKQNRELRSKPCPHCKKNFVDLTKHIKKYHS